MITLPLRILLVEDVETDVLLTIRHLNKIIESPHIKVVSNLDDCRKELINFVPDVVISDYNLPTCNGLEVLEITQATDNSVPFIFLTGAIEDEEMAANTILAGASGFVLKKDMNNLDEKLRPILKKIVFNMDSREELRERIRRNKIAVNQIHNYLDNIKMDNEEQKQNINKIRQNIEGLNFDDDAK
ncbi:response regulator [Antarcticibacterium flavum]|uniref:Response regulator n=1 Tax=Antarcticibacterium flavum TaxID=2058175 RepID=A0A5B7WZB9_9FLAO|nr:MULTISPECIES: response regulator [Antarcticibacterium]MCM4158721.1 response regulator [Antarcticibacterium sp. W02-3]QCY68574.1 response regulator [Antarcticibacterium flavum]